MGIFNNIWGTMSNIGFNFRARIGIPSNTVEIADGEANSIIYTCCSILADNVSRMPVNVKIKGEEGITLNKEHYLFKLLRYRPNSYQSPQKFWSTLEYHRGYYGNAFAWIHRDKSGYASWFEIVHPDSVISAKISKVNGKIIYKIEIGIGSPETRREEVVSGDDMLHFTTMTDNGVFGISPIYALARDLNIVQQAGETVSNFYKNKATSTLALESSLGDSRNIKALQQAQKDFAETSGGPENAGKVIPLPPNTKLVSIASNYADAQLVETLKLKKHDVAGAYHIPLYMLGDTTGDNAESSSLTFRNYTIAPIVAIYESELTFKLLNDDDLSNGVTIQFDTDILLSADLVSKTTAISTQVKSGILTPNEGAEKLGNKSIDSEWGDYHYTQLQYIPLELYEKYGLDETGTPKSSDPSTKEVK